jgi:alkylation response protein AidB-like acyl-CoA dehydrogenase
VDFAFSPEQEMLRETARAFLAKDSPSATVRRVMETEHGYDPIFWKKIADQGWTALGIPDEYGGYGSFLDLVVVLEEMGRRVVPGPFLETMAFALPALLEAGTTSQKREFLPAIAAGTCRGALAFTEPSARWDALGVNLVAERTAQGWRLDGTKTFVSGAGAADYLVVAARTAGEGEEGITLFLVKGRPAGMSVKPLSTMDLTRRWYEVAFAGVNLPSDALMGQVDRGWAPLRRVLDAATVALCAEMIGGAAQVLELSVDYAKVRHQFGKPIGIYQAISHRLADMLVEVESARSLTYYAAWAIEADAADRSVAASIAKAYTSDAYRHVAGAGLQVHGGIGFTWEHDLQLYFKRAKVSEVSLGDATFHRELVAQALDL